MLNAHHIFTQATDFARSRFGKFSIGALVVAMCAFAAMQYRANTYPADWPALAEVARGGANGPNCPDLTGTYVLHASNDTCCGFDQHSTFLADGLDTDPQMRWRTVAISGVAGRGLTLTFERDVPVGNAAPPRSVAVVPYGSRYHCEAGWLVGAPVPVFLYPTPSDLDQRTLRRAGTLPSHFRKDINGALVARADARETLRYAPSKGSAISVPYGSYIAPKWARWKPVKPVAERSLDATPVGAEKNSVVELSVSSVESLARGHLRAGVLPGPLLKNSDVFVFTIYSDTDAGIAETLRAMQADPALTTVTLNSKVKNSVGLVEATITFRLATAGAATATAN